jgi:hypothetical protein
LRRRSPDLDPGETGTEAVTSPVPGALRVLADDDLLPEQMPRHPGRHLAAGQPVTEQRVAVAADEQDVRVEGRALLVGQPVDE